MSFPTDYYENYWRSRDVTDRCLICIVMVLLVLCLGFLIYKIVEEVNNAKPKNEDQLQEDYTRLRFPYVAIIKPKNDPQIPCLGAILSRQHIVTLASCVIDRKPDDLQVVVGKFFLRNETGYETDVDKITIFPKYLETKLKRFNVALISLKGSVPYGKTICKVYVQFNKRPQGKAVVNGWGRFLQNPDGTGMKTTTIDIPLDHCDVGSICKNPLKPIFTKEKYCIGNLGSPIVQEEFPRQSLVGLVIEEGYPCYIQNKQYEMIALTPFASWIKKNVPFQ